MGSSNAAAGLILLGLGVMLLLLFVTGQLQWLFDLIATANAARTAATTTTAPPPPNGGNGGGVETATLGPRPRAPSLRAVA